MNTKEILLLQLSACHTQNTWFVSLINSINGLTEEQAIWKPNETTNSIVEITNHLIYYNQRFLNRFKDIKNAKVTENNTFRSVEGRNWDATVKQINEIMSEWNKAVKEADEKKLDNWASEIAHLTIHTTYHTGQILYIRKLQGSWNSEEGVRG
ncbi:hypothetical protein WQ54_08670 [Bacillus sp. SA1-12]|uniref:DinB family protein n=1 Tax=Bacillus sp. SA1-12 TaxID=1455638 RepID=UPI0006266061|nr:DinB family protein [Bacillus sp. SA1-12]KKI92672.1 hypothetical protein WQ54_08670 [Bacillus sp. SA1-12]